MPTKYGTPEHWRDRAAEARAQAEQMSDEAARQAMLSVAESYEQIAKRAEAKLGQRSSCATRSP
jgi:hypothetical protein